MKKLLSAFILTMVVLNVHTQEDKKFFFGLGTGLSIPTGDLTKFAKLGYSVELQGSYTLSNNVEAFLQAGASVFSAKSVLQDESIAIPVLLGARYKAGWFAAGLGLGYGTLMVTSTSTSGFAYSPQVGYTSRSYECFLHYTAIATEGFNTSFFGVKVFRKF